MAEATYFGGAMPDKESLKFTQIATSQAISRAVNLDLYVYIAALVYVYIMDAIIYI